VDYPPELRPSLPKRNKFAAGAGGGYWLIPPSRGWGPAKFLALALLVALVVAPARAQPGLGPQGPEQGELRAQLWLVPSQDKAVPMRTMLFRPAGPGPFPLVIINHGSVSSASRRAEWRQPTFIAASEWFLRRGYAVAVPQRPGHGETGGRYLESNSPTGGCADADYRVSGFATADSIQAALDYLAQQPFVKKTDAIVVGQSAGGWGSLALASRNPRQVKAVINFAGGRGGHVGGRPNNNCKPERLIDAAASFGKSARIPVLSIYTENDTYFGPSISKPLNDAFRNAGGRVDFRLLPSFGLDGHTLFGARNGAELWSPIVDEFLKNMK
jgi:dienelactone hydrolase